MQKSDLINKRIPWNKGRRLSEAHKESIRLGCKGMHKGSDNPMYNVHLTPWNKNKRYKWSEEARDKNKNSEYYFKNGNQHPNWKEGISVLNNLIRQTEQYKRWRKDVYKRDKYKCVECFETKTLEAHHEKELSVLIQQYMITTLQEALDCKELWELSNGKTLCNACHKWKTKGLMKRDDKGRFSKVH